MTSISILFSFQHLFFSIYKRKTRFLNHALQTVCFAILKKLVTNFLFLAITQINQYVKRKGTHFFYGIKLKDIQT